MFDPFHHDSTVIDMTNVILFLFNMNDLVRLYINKSKNWTYDSKIENMGSIMRYNDKILNIQGILNKSRRKIIICTS